jgi:GrpB-like predicted nucleotidyltransferase (UPF0157 family)
VALEDRIRRVTRERIDIVEYDPAWPTLFESEKKYLLSCLPQGMIVRVEHFGSTAVPGLAAKPIVDMLVEVASLDDVRRLVVPILEAAGYEYFWRPTFGDDEEPFYAFFIKRDSATGRRTHHVHMVESDFSEHWERLLFRDYLIANPGTAREYEDLKKRLATESPNDRVRYTHEKRDFILAITECAKRQVSSHEAERDSSVTTNDGG